jgi:hypothetical protein
MRDDTNKFVMAGSAKPRGFRALVTIWLMAASLSPAAIAFGQNAQMPVPNAAGGPQAVGVQPVPPATAPASVVPQAQGQGQDQGLFPAQPPPAERPGFIYAFGRWWDSTRSKFQDLPKPNDAADGAAAATKDAVQGAVHATQGAASATQDAFKNAARATKDAADTLFKLPGTRVVEVYERCAIAPNGAPDCRTAASSACRAKGFTSGNPVDVQSSQNCPPAIWMSGREPVEGECPEETVVLMAACH